MALTPGYGSHLDIFDPFDEANWTPIPPATFNDSYVAHTGNVHFPVDGPALQALFDNAGGPGGVARGDLIVLDTTTQYLGSFRPPALAGTQPINIMSSVHYNGGAIGMGATAIRGPGKRVVLPDDNAFFATMLSTDTQGVWDVYNQGTGCSYFRLIWIKLGVVPYPTYPYSAQFNVVRLAWDKAFGYTSPSQLPRHHVFDHVLVDGTVGHPTFRDSAKCVSMNIAEVSLRDSIVDGGYGAAGIECHAVDGYYGSGPYIIDNNTLHSPGINVLWGGAGAAAIVDSQGLIQAQDITMTRNYMYKDYAKYFNVSGVVVKNWYESKGSPRWKVWGNVCDTMWGNQGQAGFPVLVQNIIGSSGDFTNNPDLYRWRWIEDLDFSYNMHLNSSAGPNIGSSQLGSGANPPPGWPTRRVRNSQNLYWGLNAPARLTGAINGRQLQVIGPRKFHSYEHNTWVFLPSENDADATNLLGFDQIPVPSPYYGMPVGTRYRGNIGAYGKYGIGGTGATDNQYAAQAKFDPTSDITGNLIYGKSPASVSAAKYDKVNNMFLASVADVLFNDWANGDFGLQAGSPAIGFGPGGTNAGCDYAQLLIETAHSVDGQWP